MKSKHAWLVTEEVKKKHVLHFGTNCGDIHQVWLLWKKGAGTKATFASFFSLHFCFKHTYEENGCVCVWGGGYSSVFSL